MGGSVVERLLPERLASWRSLGLFWAGVIAVLGGGATVLAIMGPPPRRSTPAAFARAPASPPAAAPVAVAAPGEYVARLSQPAHPGRATPGPIADPDPALIEPGPDPGHMLPRVAADGRLPMQVYAAGFDPTTRRPRVGLLLAGIGLDAAASEAAIHNLPGGVSLAISPYAQLSEHLLAAARIAEHEYLISVPMEPQSFPLNDPGNHALMTQLAPEENLKRLDWALSRVAGFVGATGALGRMRGERFAAQTGAMQPVLQELAGRGLLYVDPRPGGQSLPSVWSRHVDLVIDDPNEPGVIDAKLAELSRLAKTRGSALGLAGAVRPATVERIAAWANELAAEGLALAPVSALAEPPAGTEPRP